ncbi:hypothetical protein [Arthrobacter crystallopoietes]|uniref:hypothetical protein n=1 Tax=Crystallibacter crystallopoietes TaxID=37928 RepID=UPI001ABE1534|nr:hypothetical protein [Arthrobacter crystallopoietes]QTG80260.1 hypothetical protein J5251_15495 [Arthrobacter crystallopoietes]
MAEHSGPAPAVADGAADDDGERSLPPLPSSCAGPAEEDGAAAVEGAVPAAVPLIGPVPVALQLASRTAAAKGSTSRGRTLLAPPTSTRCGRVR